MTEIELNIPQTADKSDILSLRKQLQKEHRILTERKFLRNKSAVLGLSITLLLFLVAIFAPVISGHDPYKMVMADRLMPPSGHHLFGTDTFGRDLFARVLYGSRISVAVGGSVCLITMVFGIVIGLLSGYYKQLDNLLMRICDGLKAIPNILLAIALMAMLGANIRNVIISLAIVHIPDIARITRSAALTITEQTYIEAMRALGAKPARIIWNHIAPNVLSPVIVQLSFIFAKAIVIEAALSFLGVGIPAPIPSWGNILYEGKTVIFQSWWLVLFPGIFMAFATLGLNLLGDGLRDVLDPATN